MLPLADAVAGRPLLKEPDDCGLMPRMCTNYIFQHYLLMFHISGPGWNIIRITWETGLTCAPVVAAGVTCGWIIIYFDEQPPPIHLLALLC